MIEIPSMPMFGSSKQDQGSYRKKVLSLFSQCHGEIYKAFAPEGDWDWSDDALAMFYDREQGLGGCFIDNGWMRGIRRLEELKGEWAKKIWAGEMNPDDIFKMPEFSPHPYFLRAFVNWVMSRKEAVKSPHYETYCRWRVDE